MISVLEEHHEKKSAGLFLFFALVFAPLTASADKIHDFLEKNLQTIKTWTHGDVTWRDIQEKRVAHQEHQVARIHFTYDNWIENGVKSWVDFHFDKKGNFVGIGNSSKTPFTMTSLGVAAACHLAAAGLDPDEDRLLIWGLKKAAERADAKALLSFFLKNS